MYIYSILCAHCLRARTDDAALIVEAIVIINYYLLII